MRYRSNDVWFFFWGDHEILAAVEMSTGDASWMICTSLFQHFASGVEAAVQQWCDFRQCCSEDDVDVNKLHVCVGDSQVLTSSFAERLCFRGMKRGAGGMFFRRSLFSRTIVSELCTEGEDICTSVDNT